MEARQLIYIGDILMAKNEELLFLLKERNYDPTLFKKEKEPNKQSNLMNPEFKQSNGNQLGWVNAEVSWTKRF